MSLELAAKESLEVLKQILVHFEDGAPCVYADGLICPNEETLHQNVERVTLALAAELEPDAREFVHVPRSKQKKIALNALGAWVGFIGKRRLRIFGSGDEAREKAYQWLHEAS